MVETSFSSKSLIVNLHKTLKFNSLYDLCNVNNNELFKSCCVISLYRYEFHTKKNDIAFGVQRIAENGGRVDVLPIERYNCHMVWEDGEISLQLPGQCKKLQQSHY